MDKEVMMQMLIESLEVIRHYADENSWHKEIDTMDRTVISLRDAELMKPVPGGPRYNRVGGKRARMFEDKWNKIL